MNLQAFSPEIEVWGMEREIWGTVFLKKKTFQVSLIIQVWGPENLNIWFKLHSYMISQVCGHLIGMQSRGEELVVVDMVSRC